MAEIHVEPKKQSSPAWLWILVSLIIVAAVAYFLTRNNTSEENTTTDTTPTSYIQDYQSADMVYCYEAA